MTKLCNFIKIFDNFIVTSSRDNNVLKIWDTKTNELIRTLSGHSSEISGLVVMKNNFLGEIKNVQTIYCIQYC